MDRRVVGMWVVAAVAALASTACQSAPPPASPEDAGSEAPQPQAYPQQPLAQPGYQPQYSQPGIPQPEAGNGNVSPAPPAPPPVDTLEPKPLTSGEEEEEIATMTTSLTAAESELTQALSANTNATDGCGRVCKALDSMRRSVAGICDLAGGEDTRCVSAKGRLERAQKRVDEAGCGCG